VKHTLFNVLANDERVLVLSSEGDGMIITWNQSLTLQWWVSDAGCWEEVAVRTLSSEPVTFKDARAAALRWHLDVEESA
jgi:hypothetical protein